MTSLVVTESQVILHREAVGCVGRVLGDIDSRFRTAGRELVVPASYAAVLEKIEESTAELRLAMTTDGDVDAALARVASDAVLSIAAIDKQRFGR